MSKSKKVIQALQLIIREEVRKEVKKQVKSIIGELNKPEPIQASYMAESEEMVSNGVDLNVKDPVLNKILSETKGGIANGQEEWPTMGGGPINSIAQMNNVQPQQQIDPSLMQHDFMKKAMSGHSAKVVKAIEAKKGKNR